MIGATQRERSSMRQRCHASVVAGRGLLGFLGTVATMWWAFPEVRGGWWFALLLIEPMLVESVLLGQLPFEREPQPESFRSPSRSR